MQRQRDELVPAIRDATPQARHCFTVADQVNQLVSAREADPDRGFMARMMALCSLPRTNPGNRHRYVRRNGPYTLVMSAGGLCKLPYGNLPRLLIAWVCTEVLRTRKGSTPPPKKNTNGKGFHRIGVGELIPALYSPLLCFSVGAI